MTLSVCTESSSVDDANLKDSAKVAMLKDPLPLASVGVGQVLTCK